MAGRDECLYEYVNVMKDNYLHEFIFTLSAWSRYACLLMSVLFALLYENLRMCLIACRCLARSGIFIVMLFHVFLCVIFVCMCEFYNATQY